MSANAFLISAAICCAYGLYTWRNVKKLSALYDERAELLVAMARDADARALISSGMSAGIMGYYMQAPCPEWPNFGDIVDGKAEITDEIIDLAGSYCGWQLAAGNPIEHLHIPMGAVDHDESARIADLMVAAARTEGAAGGR